MSAMTPAQLVDDLLAEALALEPEENIQFAYDYYVGFYIIKLETMQAISDELIRCNLVHCFHPYSTDMHVKMKEMRIDTAIEYLSRFN